MEIAAFIILIILSLIGFAAIFFTTFGTNLIIIGAVIYALATGLKIITLKTLIVLFIMYLCAEVSEYLFIIIGAKKLGASNAAVVGSIIGGIAGAIAGITFLGVGVIIGTFLGLFLGAFLVEYIIQKDLIKSLRAGAGSVMGRVGSILVKVVLALGMMTIIFWKMATYPAP